MHLQNCERGSKLLEDKNYFLVYGTEELLFKIVVILKGGRPFVQKVELGTTRACGASDFIIYL